MIQPGSQVPPGATSAQEIARSGKPYEQLLFDAVTKEQEALQLAQREQQAAAQEAAAEIRRAMEQDTAPMIDPTTVEKPMFAGSPMGLLGGAMAAIGAASSGRQATSQFTAQVGQSIERYAQRMGQVRQLNQVQEGYERRRKQLMQTDLQNVLENARRDALKTKERLAALNTQKAQVAYGIGESAEERAKASREAAEAQREQTYGGIRDFYKSDNGGWFQDQIQKIAEGKRLVRMPPGTVQVGDAYNQDWVIVEEDLAGNEEKVMKQLKAIIASEPDPGVREYLNEYLADAISAEQDRVGLPQETVDPEEMKRRADEAQYGPQNRPPSSAPKDLASLLSNYDIKGDTEEERGTLAAIERLSRWEAGDEEVNLDAGELEELYGKASGGKSLRAQAEKESRYDHATADLGSAPWNPTPKLPNEATIQQAQRNALGRALGGIENRVLNLQRGMSRMMEQPLVDPSTNAKEHNQRREKLIKDYLPGLAQAEVEKITKGRLGLLHFMLTPAEEVTDEMLEQARTDALRGSRKE